jgi:hypothetical protein
LAPNAVVAISAIDFVSSLPTNNAVSKRTANNSVITISSVNLN